MTALFILADQYRAAGKTLANLDLDAQTIADTLEGLSGELEAKAQNIGYLIRNLESTTESIEAFTAAQQDRAKAIKARAESLRAYLKSCMEATGIEKIEGPGLVLSFRKSSAVVIDDEGLLPAEFMPMPPPRPPAPDKSAIAAAIKAGREVPGARVEFRRNLQVK